MKEIKIIHTSDIHGYLFSTNYVKDINQGLLSFVNYIEELKKSYSVLLLDSGDLLQGSPLTFYLNKFEKNNDNFENTIITALNHVGFNVFTPGNHEFNYGFDYLQKSLAFFKGDIVVANIDGIENIINSKPYIIFEVNKKKIAIIGFTTAKVPIWEQPINIQGLTFNSVLDTYAKYEKELKEKSDFIIVNYHGGFEAELDDLNNLLEEKDFENEGAELLKKFNSIDVLFTGHQHRIISQKVNNTICMQPGNNAGLIDEITLSENLKVLDFKQVPSIDLISKSNIKSIDDMEFKFKKYLDQVIGTVNIDMLIDDPFNARINSHPLVNFLNDMQLEISGADISATSLFDSAVGFSKEITIKNVLANYPFANTLKVLEITKKDLKDILEVSASYFTLDKGKIGVSSKFTYPKAQHYNYDLFGGINYTFDLTKKVGERVVKIEFINKGIDENKIKIVVNNYRVSTTDLYPAYKNKNVIKEIDNDMIELLLNYISEKKHIVVSDVASFNILVD